MVVDEGVPNKPRAAGSRSLWQCELRSSWLIGFLVGYLGIVNLLLWRFLDFADLPLKLLTMVLTVSLCWSVTRRGMSERTNGPTVATIGICFLVALGIFILGGEGRILYANADWQVRDAVLRDLTVNRWPFIYITPGGPLVLRAPVGMFLLPALAGKVAGAAASDIFLLLQNSVLLTSVLALGSTLFQRRQRAIVLLVVLLFSGLDIIGNVLEISTQGHPIPDHLEGWAGIQFSSHLTQAFWAPHHALAGWIGALLFLLWRAGTLRLGGFYAFIPLLPLLSPLGAMGVIPFAIYAGVHTLMARHLRIIDILLPAMALPVAVPALLYLSAGGGTVGLGSTHVSASLFIEFELLEAMPYLIAAGALAYSCKSERACLIIVTACLIFAPLIQIGESADFGMRASITALALLAVQTGLFLSSNIFDRVSRVLVGLVLVVGAATPCLEVVRALTYRPTPHVQCSLWSAWNQVVLLPIGSKATYFVALESLPATILPAPVAAVRTEDDPTACWPRHWRVRRWRHPSSDGY